MVEKKCWYWLFLCMVLTIHVGFIQAKNPTNQNILIVVNSQPHSYHATRAQQFRSSILEQASLLNIQTPVVLLHEQWPMAGAWTILPIIPSIASQWSDSVAAVMICDEGTQIELGSLMTNLSAFDLSKNLFLGRPLRDSEATIIHHFAFHEDPSKFLYPDFAACFVLSSSLIQSISHRMKTSAETMDFSIDASHELAKFIWNIDADFKLTEANFLCGFKANVIESGCATWLPNDFPQCTLSAIDDNDLFIAVKTCQKYHEDRLAVVKKTWAKETQQVTYFSDVEDRSVPTVTLGIANTERGHCAKLMAILKYVYDKLDRFNYKWIMIADDDTLVSVKRLRRLLSCYNSSEPIALGERYGYGLQRNGYNYITLGGGMVLSHTTLRWIIKSGTCVCAAPDAPDDMTFGLCLKHLGIPIVHSPHFHQARPADYSEFYLRDYVPVTFHRHWMNDPYRVYSDWLTDLSIESAARDEL